MRKNKILVTGAHGQLGSSLRDIAGEYKGYEFVFTDIAELDITDRAAVKAMLTAEKPTWVINAAAYTDVEGAETHADQAALINAAAPEILAGESAAANASIIHISTDYVFDGKQYSILDEDQPVNPLSVYGKTKLEGEKLVAAANPRHIILRTSWLYSRYGKNFVKTMLRLGAQKPEVQVVDDQWGSPTWAGDLALAVMTAIQAADRSRDPAALFGLYHYSNEGATCWADFAHVIMEISKLNCAVKGIGSALYPAVAARPAFSVMDKSKFKRTFNAVIPEWEESLEKVIPAMSATDVS